jgi:hypothetical protein
MKETIENKNLFSDFSTGELFDYLLDNLIIPPDSEFDDWMRYRKDMLEAAIDFYERNVNVEI